MSYLERLKNKNKPQTVTARTEKSTHTPLLSVFAVPKPGISEKTQLPSCSFCSDDTGHISENKPESVPHLDADLQEQEPVEKAPETTGRKWTAGNPYTCKCGFTTGWTMDGKTLCPVCYQDLFSPPSEDKAPEAEVSVFKKQDRLRHVKPSPIALDWLQEHKQKLLDSGWTRSELYDRRKYRQGIAWLDLWEQAFSMAYLHEDGTIEFECSRNGKDFFWTARPRAMAPTKTVATMTTISEVKR